MKGCFQVSELYTYFFSGLHAHKAVVQRYQQRKHPATGREKKNFRDGHAMPEGGTDAIENKFENLTYVRQVFKDAFKDGDDDTLYAMRSLLLLALQFRNGKRCGEFRNVTKIKSFQIWKDFCVAAEIFLTERGRSLRWRLILPLLTANRHFWPRVLRTV